MRLSPAREAIRPQFQNGFRQLTTFTEGQSGQIAVVANEKIEDEIVNVRRGGAKVLKQIEVRSA